VKKICECGVCGKNSFESLWHLPGLPLTERFGKYDPSLKLSFDQDLYICTHCGHIQLGYQMDPTVLYTPGEYAFRTAQSQTATRGSETFLIFFKKVAGNRTFKSLLDVGGNDRYLCKRLENEIPERTVIDPVCCEDDGKILEGVRVIGRLVETLDLRKEMTPPDLVFCRHTLEHISSPRNFCRQMIEQSDSRALFIFEIPSLEGIYDSLRFETVFHQHSQYFDQERLAKLMQEVGGRLIDMWVDPTGFGGGVHYFAFEKGTQTTEKTMGISERKEIFQKKLQLFKQQSSLIRHLLEAAPEPIYGYGASLMLAMVAYHWEYDFSKMTAVLDDSPEKQDWGYQNVPVRVQCPSLESPRDNATMVVTSIENTRAISKAAQRFSPKRLITSITS